MSKFSPSVDFEPPPGAQQGRAAPRYRYVRRRWIVLLTVIDALGDCIAAIARRLLAQGRSASAPSEPGSVLLVQLDHLGDALLTTAILPALRQAWPQARIDVLAAPWNREVLASDGLVDRVWISSRNRFCRPRRFGAWAAMLWWGWRLRRERYDVAVDVRGELPMAAMIWLTAARRRVGWNCGGGGFLLTESVPYEPGRHELASRQALLQTLLGRPLESQERAAPRFEPNTAARRRVAASLSAVRLAERGFVVLHVGAGTPAKRWPPEHWRELIGRILLDMNLPIVLVGGTGERAIALHVLQGRDWPGVYNWVERFTLHELAALLQSARVVIGSDSGPAHLAAAVGATLITLFSGTNDPGQWRPHGARVTVLRHEVPCGGCRRQRCPLAEHRCMAGLKPTHVMATLHDVLGDARPVEVEGKSDRLPLPLVSVERSSA